MKQFRLAYFPEETSRKSRRGKKIKLALLTNERIVHNQKVLKQTGDYLICKEKACPFNHFMRQELSMGDDLSVVSEG
jgi:lipoate synthase